MGFAFATNSLMPDQLFMLLVIAMSLGSALTALTLYLTFKMAQSVGASPGVTVDVDGKDL